jgi:hypothetical protein
VQASYNVVASALTSPTIRSATWTSATHNSGQIGTNDIAPQNEAGYAQDAFNAFINSPPHRQNVLTQGGESEGVAIVGYTFHGFNHVVCISCAVSTTLDVDGFDFAWEHPGKLYCFVSKEGPAFDELPGCTREAVKNCQVK